MKKILKGLGLITIVLFLSLFLGRTNTYYENKSVLTDEAIARFEKDLKEGKEIVASNYIEEEKDYSNKISNFGLKTSNLIEKTFNKGINHLMKYLASLQNS